MTLAEFAYLLDVDPKWVQNAAAALAVRRFREFILVAGAIRDDRG
jgi:hypothetical protein